MFEINDRVWFAETDPSDTGTVINISSDPHDAEWPYLVHWTSDDEEDWFSADQLRAVK